ncbi:MAG: hypothetical protein ABFD97_07790 [Syntrophobacter sp.]
MKNRKFSKYLCAFALFAIPGFAVCIMAPDAQAGGVRFGFGVDLPIGSEPVPPPVAVYESPVVVERAPCPPPPRVVMERPVPPPQVIVEQSAPVVVVRRPPPAVVYGEPVVVERRTTTYYYPNSYQYRSQYQETEREYYRQRSSNYVDNN